MFLTLFTLFSHSYHTLLITEIFTFSTLTITKSEILKQSKPDQNFVGNFWKCQKWKRKLAEYIKIEVLYLEILLTYIKFCNFLFNSVKVWKIYGKFWLNDLENLLNICWILLTFIQGIKKMNIEQKLFGSLMKFHGI